MAPQKLAEYAGKIWNEYIEPVGKVGLTLFGVAIGVKVAYTIAASFVNAVWNTQLPPYPY